MRHLIKRLQERLTILDESAKRTPLQKADIN
jgi:hypothetical protein